MPTTWRGVQLCPAARPAAVRDPLTAEGLKTRDRWAKVYRDEGSVR